MTYNWMIGMFEDEGFEWISIKKKKKDILKIIWWKGYDNEAENSVH